MTLSDFLNIFHGDLASYFNLDLPGPAGLMDSGEEGEVATSLNSKAAYTG